MTQPNFARLIRAYEIIDGIPKNRIDLGVEIQNNDPSEIGNPNHCGTIGCAMGWLAMHPEFQALGLGIIEETCDLSWHGEAKGFATCAGRLFNITYDEARQLFGWVEEAERRYDQIKPSDKKIFKRRVREFLRSYGQL